MINPDDLLIELVAPHTRGGQYVGTPNYPIRITHKPTGITAICGWARSQHMNRALAMEMVESALTNPKLPRWAEGDVHPTVVGRTW